MNQLLQNQLLGALSFTTNVYVKNTFISV